MNYLVYETIYHSNPTPFQEPIREHKITFSFGNSFLLVSLLLTFLLFTTLSYARPTNDLISDICSKTRNPTACSQALRSDHRSASADLKGLGQIGIDLAQASAKTTYNLIASLEKTTSDPKLKGRYSSCLENYDDAIGYLDDCRRFLWSGDYGSLSTYASAVLDEPETCQDSFEDPPAAPPQLQLGNQKLENLSSVNLAISSRLFGRN